MATTRDFNVLVRELPIDTNEILDALARFEQKSKWRVIRDALVYYAAAKSKTVKELQKLSKEKLSKPSKAIDSLVND